ncbi:MAG TPA: T9SS type A sorting domain-containing protein [Paludibacter sp.]
MKHILSALFIAVLFSVSQPVIARSADGNQLITELKVFDNDSTFRYVYLYDNDGKKMLETRYYKQTNSWTRISQTEWLYEAGNCKHQIERNWKNNEWADSYKIDYNYLNGVLDNEIHKNYIDKAEQQLKKVVYQYDQTKLTSKKEYSGKSNVWTLMLQTDFKCSQTASVDSVITSVYQSGNLINQYLAVNSYSVDGHLESQLQKEKASNNDWTNTQFVSWFYSPGYSRLLTERTKTWSPETSDWENYQRTDYEYDDNKQLVSETYQHWKMMFWESDLRYYYQHDADGNEIKKTLSKPIYHEWRDLISINYSDFTGNKANLMESKYEFWGGNTGELVSSFIPFNFNNETVIQRGRSLQISYLDVAADTVSYIPETKNSIQSIPVYPNPSDGIYYINTQEYGVQSWVIADLDGRTLKNHVQSISSGVIDITDLPKGIYILKVITQTGQFTQKLIKQ